MLEKIYYGKNDIAKKVKNAYIVSTSRYAKNILDNGSLYNNIKGWENKYTNATITHPDNSCTRIVYSSYTANSKSHLIVQRFRPIYSINYNQIAFVCCKAKMNNADAIGKLDIYVGQSGTFGGGTVNIPSIDGTASDTNWHTYARRILVSDYIDSIDIDSTNVGKTNFDIKECFVVNLSEIFGRGNEPSEEWCINNLTSYADSIEIPAEYRGSSPKRIVSAYLGVRDTAIKIFGKSIKEFNTNIVPTDWNLIYNRLAVAHNEYGEWIISGAVDDTYPITYGFNGDDSNYAISISNSTSTEDSIYLYFPKGVYINPSSWTKIIGVNSYHTIYGYSMVSGDWVSSGCTTRANDTLKTVHTHSFSSSERKYYSKLRFDTKPYQTNYKSRLYGFTINSGTING